VATPKSFISVNKFIMTMATRRWSDVLRFRARQNHLGLKTRCPHDGTSTIANDNAGTRLGGGGIVHGVFLDPVASKIAVNMDLEGLGRIGLQDQALVLGSRKIATQMLHSIRV
jgi:hypothetical protein